MNARRIIQVALLLFVAVTVVYLVSQESRESVASASAESSSQVSSTRKATPAKVIVYYFHGNFRCLSCRKLESLSHEAVTTGFSEELKRGDLQWRAVNVEQSENQHFISDYRLFSRSLVLVKFRNGQQVEYKNLMKAWELLQNDGALKKYVQAEVRDYLRES
jgi:biopolymer transport protein ExbD